MRKKELAIPTAYVVGFLDTEGLEGCVLVDYDDLKSVSNMTAVVKQISRDPSSLTNEEIPLYKLVRVGHIKARFTPQVEVHLDD